MAAPKAANVLKTTSLSYESRQLAEDQLVIGFKSPGIAAEGDGTLGDLKPTNEPFLLVDVANEAKRLLKTKENVFPQTIKAKRYLKISGLALESQEVIDAEGVKADSGIQRFCTDDRP